MTNGGRVTCPRVNRYRILNSFVHPGQCIQSALSSSNLDNARKNVWGSKLSEELSLDIMEYYKGGCQTIVWGSEGSEEVNVRGSEGWPPGLTVVWWKMDARGWMLCIIFCSYVLSHCPGWPRVCHTYGISIMFTAGDWVNRWDLVSGAAHIPAKLLAYSWHYPSLPQVREGQSGSRCQCCQRTGKMATYVGEQLPPTTSR